MTFQSPSAVDPALAGYVAAFGAAAAACFASLARTRRIEDPDTRRGLVALLVTSGAWAAANVGFLVVPSRELKVAFYVAGLVIGLSTVGSWLYFCSAYTGRSLHRVPTYRRVAVSVFLAVVAIKLTNPIHGLYFAADLVAAPFPHLAVRNGAIHWVAMGLSYALAAVGYFMLFELFSQVGHDTRALLALTGLAGLPVFLDVIGSATSWLLEINYEPLGVAAFAVGVLFVFLEDFRTVKLAGDSDDAIIILGDDGRIRDYNEDARELFPGIAEGYGGPIGTVAPRLADRLDAEGDILEIERIGRVRYYRLTANPFTADGAERGRLLSLTDVTDREQYRRELERQNERLDQFASMVSHDLRNPLNVARGRIELAREDVEGADDHLATAGRALDRMEALVEDILALARQGQPIDETEPVSLSSIVEECWQVVETADAGLEVEDDLEFVADADRLRQLFENLFRNAVEHGSATPRPEDGDPDAPGLGRGGVRIRVGVLDGDAGFYVEDDGPGIPAQEREAVFESGYSTAEGGTGFGLAIVGEIADAHGWTVTATESDDGGARFEVAGVVPCGT